VVDTHARLAPHCENCDSYRNERCEGCESCDNQPRGPIMANRQRARILDSGWYTLSKNRTIAIQVSFLLLCVLIRALQFVATNDTVLEPIALSGFALIVAATVFAMFGPEKQGTPGWTFLILPTLNFAGVGLIRLVHPEWGYGFILLLLLLLFPARWLGSNPQTRGLYASIPLAIVAISSDLVRLATSASEPRLGTVLAVALFPLLTLALALAFHTTLGGMVLDRKAPGITGEATLLAGESNVEVSRMLASVLDSVEVGIVVFGPQLQPFVMNRWVRELPIIVAGGADPWQTFRSLRPLQTDRKTPYSPEKDPFTRGSHGEILSNEIVWLGENRAEQVAISLTTSPIKNGWQVGRAGILLVMTDVTQFIDAIEKRDTFVGTVSHELRTPLTTILGYLELAQDEANNLPETVVRYLQTITDNANHQLRLVNDLLEVSKARNAALTLSIENVDLGYIANETINSFRSAIDAKRIHLIFEDGPALCRIDPRRIGEVIENLVSNAVRYTPEGGNITVRVDELASSKKSPARVRLTVTDSGIGIAESEQPQLFTEFFRAENARQAAIPGAGLGLYIVKKIVDAHYGIITVRSALGQGTTIIVELPSDPPEAAAKAAAKAAAS
jgi:signal transduction histidine kinase